MMRRRALLLGVKQEKYEKIDVVFTTSQQITNVRLPQEGWTILIDWQHVVDSTWRNFSFSTQPSVNRDFNFGFYTTYCYMDIAGTRRTVSSANVNNAINRIAGKWDGQLGYMKFNTDSIRTAGSVFNGNSIGPISIQGVSSAFVDEVNTNNKITLYVYPFALSDADITNFTDNGIIY